MPTFTLFRASGALGAISLPPLGQVAIETASEAVSELQDCSFEVDDPEPGVRYSIRIGDLLADSGDGDMPAETPGEGRRFRSAIQWPSGFYFESARGET